MLNQLGIGGQITFFILVGTLILALSLAFILCIKKDKNRRSNRFFGLLLLLMCATLGHHLLILLNIYEQQAQFLFLPIYFTLSFGPLLFLAVKLRTYPSYQLRFTDWKHAILPLGQFLYFLIIYQTDIAFRQNLGRNFYSPFYGAMEMVLYISTFYAYLYSAYRFVKHKTIQMSQSQRQTAKRETFFLRRMIKMFVLLFWINSGYIATDFLMYEIFNFDLHTQFGFTRFGDVSFAVLVSWLAWCCWRMIWKGV